MTNRVRVVHYLNQFFGGIGAEERANNPIEQRVGAVGPGRLLESQLGDQADIAATLIGGDNYVVEQRATALAAVRTALEQIRPDVVVAGPAFDAGRYGDACGAVCALASNELGIPCVTALHPDNPAVALYRGQVYIVPTAANAMDMRRAMGEVARLALKLGRGQQLGSAAEEGYLPRGKRLYMKREAPGFARAADMLEARLLGRPWASEVGAQMYEVVLPAPPVEDLSRLRLGLVTSGGLVPKGNPDRLRGGDYRECFRYPIDGVENLSTAEWESVHTGFSTQILNTHNPAYVLPLPALRISERHGDIGALHPFYYSTIGSGMMLANAKQIGKAIATELKEAGVRAALLVAT
jgi:glycine reductase complex component B subunit gamma